MTAALIVIIAVLYVFGAGVTFARARKVLIRKHGCNGISNADRHRKGTCPDGISSNAHRDPALCLAAIWFFSIIWHAGMLIPSREERTAQRHARELAEARHQTLLAHERAMQVRTTNRTLEELGVNASLVA